MKFKIFIIVNFLIASVSDAQEKLSFNQALELTLAHNYNIQLAKIEEKIALNNASKSNNNYLPTVTATGNYNWAYLGVENELATETINFDPNSSFNYGASVTASYTLFDGQGRKYSFLQSKENLTFTQLQLEQIIQNTVLELSAAYYEVARLEENMNSLEQAVVISKDRLSRATSNYKYGQTNKLDVLNAKVDLNNDSIAWVTGKQELENLKRNLNFIMGQQIDQSFAVEHTVDIRQNIAEVDVLSSAEQKNLNLLLAKSNIKINRYAVNNSKSNWLPSLNASTSYNYNGSENPNSPFTIRSSQNGPQAGLTLNWSLFNGSNSTAVKNAKLNLKSREVELQSFEQSIQSQAMNTHATYLNLLFVLRSQSDNVNTAKDNFERSKNAHELGQINATEFRQAQLNLLMAEQALSQAKYNAKNAELQVLAIMGELVK